jgi:hypothetical protein
MSRREFWIVGLLCGIAAARVFLYAAAFPFFSNGDEDLHFDVIVRYAAAEPPRNFDVLDNRTLDFVALYASPEFLQKPDDFSDHRFPPPLWKQPPEEAAPVLEATKDAWKREMNWEASQPPFYYGVAALWWKMGNALGLRGIQGLYWLRFLNVLLLPILIVLGFVCARMIAPESISFRIGTALVIAFMPQDVFYVMSNDVLSPVCFGIVFLCTLQWLSKPVTPLLGLTTGLAIAAAYLTKLSNAPLVAAAFIVILANSVFQRSRGANLRAMSILVVCAAAPICAWMIWCRNNFGDITGSTTKAALLGWTAKSFRDWFDHPIFSLRGLWTFWSELIERFWRGELMWHHEELGSSAADNFYAILSIVVLGIALASIRWRALRSNFQVKALLLAALAFFSAIAFLFLLSIKFDFGQCPFPSRDHPFFTSGRLMLGALVPFALLFAFGVVDLLRRINAHFPAWLALAVIAAIAAASEFLVKYPVFASEHNWFHL